MRQPTKSLSSWFPLTSGCEGHNRDETEHAGGPGVGQLEGYAAGGELLFADECGGWRESAGVVRWAVCENQ